MTQLTCNYMIEFFAGGIIATWLTVSKPQEKQQPPAPAAAGGDNHGNHLLRPQFSAKSVEVKFKAFAKEVFPEPTLWDRWRR